MSKFKVGDRVRVVSCVMCKGEFDKTRGCRHLDTDGLKGTGPFTIAELTWDGFALAADGEVSWREVELELVTQGDKPMARRTFKLLTESPSLLKGALVQERCDDGTQPYDLINADTHSKDPSYDVSFAKRELVEEAPKFWVEVFKVEPEYMTKDELAAFTAFKKAQKPSPKKRKATKK